MEVNLNKSAWREAATGGLWLGLALSGVMALGYLGRENPGFSFATLLSFASLVVIPFLYTRKMAGLYGAAGFTYTQGVGFILRLLLFAGVITGLGQFILQNYVDPEYYRDIMEQMFFAMNLPEEQFDTMLRIIRNPISMVFAGIISTLFYGGIPGLFIAVFTKRPPDFFGGDAPGENGTDQNA